MTLEITNLKTSLKLNKTRFLNKKLQLFKILIISGNVNRMYRKYLMMNISVARLEVTRKIVGTAKYKQTIADRTILMGFK